MVTLYPITQTEYVKCMVTSEDTLWNTLVLFKTQAGAD